MKKNNRELKGLAKRGLAIVLCCLCLLATVPVSAMAQETAPTAAQEKTPAAGGEQMENPQGGTGEESPQPLTEEIPEGKTVPTTQDETLITNTATNNKEGVTDEQPGEQPGDQNGEQPGEQPADQPGEQPADQPGEQPGEQPAEQPGEQPADQPGEQPDDQPGEQPGEQPADQPGEQPADQPADQPGEQPGDQPGEQPGEQPDEQIGGASNAQLYIDALNALSARVNALDPASDNYDAEYDGICEEMEQVELKISSAYDAGEITFNEFEALNAQLSNVQDVLFADVEPEEDASTLEGENVNPDANYILVGKTFVGITADQIPEGFTITVDRESEENHVLSLDSATLSEDGLTYSWRIENVGAGTYTVTESNAAIEKYNLATSGTGTVEVKAADFAVTSFKETSCSHLDWPVKIDGDQNVLFAAALTTGGCVVISKEPLTATQRLTVAKQVTSLGGNWKDPVNFYSIAVNGYGPWSINDKSLKYDPDEGKIWLSQTSDWSHVATLEYSITAASNPDISITNTYTPNTRNLTVKKTVSGNMYDANKEFAFTVTYGDKTETFNLKKDGTKTVEGIPVGAVVTVTEEPGSYTYSLESISAIVNKEDETYQEEENSVTFTMPAEDVEVVINNDKTVKVDTGVSLETLPYILILGVVAVGVVLMVRRRRHGYDD